MAAKTSKQQSSQEDQNGKAQELKEVQHTCGIIMPISGSDTYPAEHWSDVKVILEDVIREAGFTPNLVSDADEIGIIHNRIVSNIYNNPIVVCDVSSKNPNVMFELGLRLAFDKATIIIKDEITTYNFDTAPIEHLTYPKDLRYSNIISFKTKLAQKLQSTYKASLDHDYSTFLKNFVQYKPKLQTKEVGSQEFILQKLDVLTREVSELRRNSQAARSVENYLVSTTPRRSTLKALLSDMGDGSSLRNYLLDMGEDSDKGVKASTLEAITSSTLLKNKGEY